jgi:hypothetical protein
MQPVCQLRESHHDPAFCLTAGHSQEFRFALFWRKTEGTSKRVVTFYTPFPKNERFG